MCMGYLSHFVYCHSCEGRNPFVREHLDSCLRRNDNSLRRNENKQRVANPPVLRLVRRGLARSLALFHKLSRVLGDAEQYDNYFQPYPSGKNI